MHPKTTNAIDAPTDVPRRTTRRARTGAVAAAVVAALAVWLVADPVAGVELSVRGQGGAVDRVGPVAVAVSTALAGCAGWALLALLERLTRRARAVWTTVALAVLLLSLGGPVGQGTTTSAVVGLVCLHVAAAVILVPLLATSAGGTGKRAGREHQPSPTGG